MAEQDGATWSPGRYRSGTREELSDSQQRVYDVIAGGPRKNSIVPVVDEEGRLLGPFALMAVSPGVGEAVQELGAAIRFRSSLRDSDRELAILMVASHRRCGFEWFAHEQAAGEAGLDDETLRALRRQSRPAGLEGTTAAVWSAMNAMLASDRLAKQEYESAVAVLGAEGLAELTWLCGYYSMLALALAVFEPELPEGATSAFVEGADVDTR